MGFNVSGPPDYAILIYGNEKGYDLCSQCSERDTCEKSTKLETQERSRRIFTRKEERPSWR